MCGVNLFATKKVEAFLLKFVTSPFTKKGFVPVNQMMLFGRV